MDKLLVLVGITLLSWAGAFITIWLFGTFVVEPIARAFTSV